MITITVEKNKGKYTLTAKGHAGYCPGNDIVCAAVSALLQTLAQRVMKEFSAGRLVSENIRLESGDSKIKYTGSNRIMDEIADTIEDGLNGIQESFPEHLKISCNFSKR